jgi:hypothetical protein
MGVILVSPNVGYGRSIAALPPIRGNPLPLFWHCRLAAGRKALIYGVWLLGTRLAISRLRKIRSPKGFPT